MINDDYTFLSRQTNPEEIKLVLFDMDPYKAPGVDGLQAFFYQKYRHLVGPSLCRMVMQLFETGYLEKGVNNTKIVLIPKVDNLEQWRHFRPISLCNVTYKLITKVIANRLKPFIGKLVSPMRSSFVKGRHILDNIIIVHELIHSMGKRRGKKGVIAIKVDLDKAYDRLN